MENMSESEFKKYVELLCKILNVDPKRKEANEQDKHIK